MKLIVFALSSLISIVGFSQPDKRLTTVHSSGSSSPALGLFLDKWKKINNVFLEEQISEKSLFDNDTIHFNRETSIYFNRIGEVISQEEMMKKEKGNSRIVFNDQVNYFMESDSTYSFQHSNIPSAHFTDLFSNNGILSGLRKAILHHHSSITQLPDTIISGNKCHYFRNSIYDSTVNGKRNYIDHFIAFDRILLSPQFVRVVGFSTVMKSGQALGSYSLYATSTIIQVRTNIGKNRLVNFKVPAGYKPSKKLALLPVGADAPKWSAKTLDDQLLSSEMLKNANALIYLTVIDCPANTLAMRLINKLDTAYEQKLKIITIFGDSKKRVERYSVQCNTSVILIADGEDIKKDFNSPGSPFFYLLDKRGKIFFSHVGFSDDLEGILRKQIDELQVLTD